MTAGEWLTARVGQVWKDAPVRVRTPARAREGNENDTSDLEESDTDEQEADMIGDLLHMLHLCCSQLLRLCAVLVRDVPVATASRSDDDDSDFCFLVHAYVTSFLRHALRLHLRHERVV
jgi:hypothetical protein